jgi:hypothetical protein
MADILVLGKGFTGTYLFNLAQTRGLQVAATTTSGRDATIRFEFDPLNPSLEAFSRLPRAKTLVVTFPLSKAQGTAAMMDTYHKTHLIDGEALKPQWILLGSTRPWSKPSPGKTWITVHDPIDPQSDPLRMEAEQEFLNRKGCVLNLAGLWGGPRQPRNWLKMVAASKDSVSKKTSVHLIHGEDVAHAVLAVHDHFTPGKRWLLTDERVYDWFDLIYAWGSEQQRQWVQELMEEQGIPGLPRSVNQLKRALSSRDFWEHFKLSPLYGRPDSERAPESSST